MRSSFLGVVLMLTAIAATAEAQVAAPPPGGARCDAVCLQAKVDHHLTVLMAEIGPSEVAPQKREEAMQASLRDLAAAGPAAVRAAREAYDHWSREEAPEPTTGARPGEMRWRAVYLLGSLPLPLVVRVRGRRAAQQFDDESLGARRGEPNPQHDVRRQSLLQHHEQRQQDHHLLAG